MNKNPPKEKIINQAIQFHLEGNITEAIRYYQYCINHGFNDAMVFSNYGVILQNLGKFREAELSYRKALEIKPDYPEAYSNLGNILRYQGKSKEAELSIRKALEIKPDYAEAYSNLANILKNQGKFKEAELSIRKALEIKPDYAEAYSNLGNLLSDLGKLREAELSIRKALEIKPNYAEAHSNLGTILKDIGKFKEAELSYRKALEIKPNLAEGHYNLGNILRDFGRLQEAELSYRKALKIKPNLAEGHLNLGNILRDFGRLQEAELSTLKAIEFKPDLAIAHVNLGTILRDLGKLKEAELSIRKALEIKPNIAEGHSNLGNILSDLGKIQEAFNSYIKAIEIDPKFFNIYPSITKLLNESDIRHLNPAKLKEILNLLLERNDVPHKELFNAFYFLHSKKIFINLEEIETDFSKLEIIANEKVIINGFKKIIFKDIKLEKLLTNVRKYICDRITESKEGISLCQVKFIIALAHQCFFNEYIYSLTESEKISLNTIKTRCMDGELTEANISILACYLPLYKLLDHIPSLKTFNSSDKSFQELIKLQITEPLKEIELSQKIKKMGSINDDISQKVKSQYEANPYPRWRYGSHIAIQKLSINQAINVEIKPNYINKIENEEELNVLIAGCGTGNQILFSQRYKNAKITAIDLSLSSLAYSQRKIDELGIDNVELIEMDILEVNLLEKQFDIIECGGVLHHMNNPSKGLKKLLGNLKKDGFLKLGLYSELARKDIVEARDYITNKDIQANDEEMKDFREDVFSGKIKKISNLKNWGDFFTMSECRDLCFHAQEHRFTIKQLKELLQSNKLKFLGFLVPNQIKSIYKRNFPNDKEQTNLQNWEEFEKSYPNTFKRMYQFWVCKM